MPVITEEIIKNKYTNITNSLDEKSRRLWAASEAIAYGRGGIAVLSRTTGMSNKTIYKGISEIKGNNNDSNITKRIRKEGGGRKRIADKTKGELLRDLDKMIEPATRGDPESPLRWTSKSTRKLEEELNKQGYAISYKTIGRLLKELGYSLQANRKTNEGGDHPDRDKQFEYIYEKIKTLLEKDQPVISVDTKKKELIGNFKNGGKEWHKKNEPIEVEVYDFLSKAEGKVAPYGVYDLAKNKGWVSVGISSDTAEFAVNTIRTWWYQMGSLIYENATELLITADGGGSNGYRVKLWKRELQKLATEINMTINVCHFPPGTSKWNKIEHRLFSFISKNWRGKPLINTETVINLIRNTTTKKGLTVMAVLDKNIYEKGIEVTNAEMELIRIEKDNFHPEWNYKIAPNLLTIV